MLQNEIIFGRVKFVTTNNNSHYLMIVENDKNTNDDVNINHSNSDDVDVSRLTIISREADSR